MVIDCHGHYTTVPKEVQAFRDAQIAGRADASAPHITDDQIRDSVQPQLAFQAARGTDLTIFSPRASSMGHHLGDARANLQWARLCNDLIHRVCTLFPRQFPEPTRWTSGQDKRCLAHTCADVRLRSVSLRAPTQARGALTEYA